MTDSKRITIFFAALIGLLSLTLVAVVAAQAGVWLQQYGKAEGVACDEGWSESWAEWPNGGTGGFVCTREVDDPSQPVPAAAEPAAPAPTTYVWVYGGSFTLPANYGPGSNRLALNICSAHTSGLYTGNPRAMRVNQPTSVVAFSYNPSTRVYTLQNLTASTVVAGTELECALR